MTDTMLTSATREVVIGFERHSVLIDKRINPTGRKPLAAAVAGGGRREGRRRARA